MNPDTPHWRQKTAQSAHAQTESEQAKRLLEFATPEEMLRHDAAQTPLPESLPRRLEDSLHRLPLPKARWWKRWFGR